ncbi:uncharacterized protein KY384_003181 [Bacidia gigantensis]|uniref:uncharacterized protein n=1 Tax=Bacidia gigantensis TaxID=2732470 RepID=UPI001D057BF0|nr:uncharacterized protein KY384_003181 [Bacidia gigantensis]KAG8531551.1 hypothetical protein KY384_003181 [Bacidia gigantensis]
MFLEFLDLTTAHRPLLLQDESLLFLQNGVGLYEGKYKLPDLQEGHVYLTSHRICYVDGEEPRKNSVSIELKNVDRYDFYAGFLKSSAKITLHPKVLKRSPFQYHSTDSINELYSYPSQTRSSTASPLATNSSPEGLQFPNRPSPKPSSGTWVCPICSYSNDLPTNFDPTTASSNTTVLPCQACGIKPTFAHLLKAAISTASKHQMSAAQDRTPKQTLLESHSQDSESFSIRRGKYEETHGLKQAAPFQCPRCTFLNHPSLINCEMCGTSLVPIEQDAFVPDGESLKRAESPDPSMIGPAINTSRGFDCIKLSFRAGGERTFYERLKGAMIQRKWLLQSAPPIPDPIAESEVGRQHGSPPEQLGVKPNTGRVKSAGITGLERRGLDIRKKNEAMIGSAFTDLDALMASAKEIIGLAESFAKDKDNGFPSDASQVIADSARSLDMITTKDMLSPTSGSDSLYIAELSRNLAEFLTDDSRGILKREGGVMTLVDLWAVFNRARQGVELINPADFEKAAYLWEKLKLPVRLRQFKNGLLVVQQADRTDDKTVGQLLEWLQEIRALPPPDDAVGWDWDAFGRGLSAHEAAQHFGWSIGVATEELEMAEEKGVLCREESVEGLRFWENWLAKSEEVESDDIIVGPKYPTRDDAMDEIVTNLKSSGLLCDDKLLSVLALDNCFIVDLQLIERTAHFDAARQLEEHPRT